MVGSRPAIVITAGERTRKEPYARAVERAGGLPVLHTPPASASLGRDVGDYDLLA